MATKKDMFSQFDMRTIERKIKKGEVSQKEYDAWLKSLSDAKDFSEINENDIVVNTSPESDSLDDTEDNE